MKLSEPRYTCKDYRQEMMLLNLRRRLYENDLPEEEKNRLKESIELLKQEMEMA